MPLFQESKGPLDKVLSRRRFLSLGALTVLSGMLTPLCFAAKGTYQSPKRSLSFYNTYTGESIATVYWAEGKYVSPALDEINYILRDHRTGDIKTICTRLLDLLCAIKVNLKAEHPFHIISGYRSPKTNALLRMKGRGVAKNSLHMSGKAVDISVPGYRLSELRKVAIKLRAGGVGYYPRSNFVHVDIGAVRLW
jgi:uncharacterized protein YcbK (DUF882 family)